MGVGGETGFEKGGRTEVGGARREGRKEGEEQEDGRGGRSKGQFQEKRAGRLERKRILGCYRMYHSAVEELRDIFR